MSKRVHQLAKELGISSKELIERLDKLGVKVRGHMSALDDKAIALVKKKRDKGQATSDKAKTKSKAVKPKAKKATISSTKKKAKKTDKKEKVSETKKETLKVEEIVKKEEPKEVNQEPSLSAGAQAKSQEQEETSEGTSSEVSSDIKVLRVDLPIMLKDLAVKLQVKPNELMMKLLNKKILVTINHSLDEDMARTIAGEYGYNIEKLPSQEEVILSEHEKDDDPSKLKSRAPIVTFMGHVDHGKTSLLDMIRKTKVVDKEAGGITQHISAYEVILPKGSVTFLDTPGHAAFTAMRSRGANVTDVVVLVIAADDGIMPQTREAIDHARAADVPIVVALNKIDKPNVNIDKAKKQLAEVNLLPEDWGGKTVMVGVSAKTGEGIDNLLEMLLLEAEMLELKANPDRFANGIVVEAELSKGKGPVATVLVSNGTLKVGDVVMAGLHYGKIKAMLDDRGHRVGNAGPSKPVEILGLSGVPLAGEKFYALKDEKKVRDIVNAKRMEEEKKKLEARSQKISLEDLHSKIEEGKIKELKIILKADVRGSLEALKESLEKLSGEQVKLSTIHAQVGNVNESDVMLASASNAIVIGFHVDVTPSAGALSKQEGVEIRSYNIIYQAVDDLKAAMEGMLEPIEEETFLGRAEVKMVFKVSKVGIVAGCYVSKGTIPRNAVCKLIRNKEVIYKGRMSSLKHVKDDIKEAREGFECGISLGIKDIKKGDIIEAVEVKKVARKLK